MNMKNSQEVLSSILKTAQMGQTGIRSLLRHPLRLEVKNILRSQLAEYDCIEAHAHKLAALKGWQLEELHPATRKMTDSFTAVRLMHGDIDSKAAAMMIQGNTRGMITGLKNLHNYKKSDQQIIDLSEKFLKQLQENIRQMQEFV